MGRRTRAAIAVSLVIVVTCSFTGCGGMDEESASERVTELSGVNGAIVDVQHPNAPWVDQILIRLFVADTDPAAVAHDIRAVARVAIEDPDLSGEELRFLATPGNPSDFDDPVLASITDGLSIMGTVAQELGTGSGKVEILTLTADQVREIAQQ